MVTKDELQNGIWILTGVGVIIAILLIIFVFILYVGLVRLKSRVRKLKQELDETVRRSRQPSFSTCPVIHPEEELARRGYQAYAPGHPE